MNLIPFLVVCTTIGFSSQESTKEFNGSTLKLVQVFHRHGARTPELKAVYPTDPHQRDAFMPMGYGQLTNFGRQQAYKLGKILRHRYGNFLGSIYTPDIVYAQSTDFDRTKASLLLVLAALFKPTASQMFDKEVPWQPVPINYTRDSLDFVLPRPNAYCPEYMKELERVLQTEKVQFYLKKHEKILNYLTEHSGKPITKLEHAFVLYQTLHAESSMNLTLPEWTESVFPDDLYRMAAKQCELENSNRALKRLNGGRILGKVVQNMIAKSTGTIDPEGRKIFIFSGHENNVINLLAALNVYKPHVPQFASAVIFELHYLGDKKEYAVKVYYLKDIEKKPEAQKLEGCDVLCPLKKFVQITMPNIPLNYTEECGSDIYLD